MNQEYVQHLRYKLQKRVRRLNSADGQVFHFVLKQFWVFLTSQPVLMDIVDNLLPEQPQAETEAAVVMTDGTAYVGETENASAALAYWVLKGCVESDDQSREVRIAHFYGAGSGEALDLFRDVFVEPFYEYLDEHLDDQRAILALLRRYKHRSEWFDRERLHESWQSDTRRGEKLLLVDLYRYLHDQGLDFFIEPASASGEADLVSAQTGEEPLIADGKVFDGDSRGKAYIAKGFGQVYRYTLDFNESFGYLVIYKTCERELQFSVPNNAQGIPYVTCNGKTIFIITVDIFPHTEPASKRGPLDPIVLTEAELVGAGESLTDEGGAEPAQE